MAGKLGTVEVPKTIQDGLKVYEELEGARKAEKLRTQANEAYLRVFLDTFSKDPEIKEVLSGSEKNHSKAVKIAVEDQAQKPQYVAVAS